MKIRVIGKQRIQGTSKKTGKGFDFIVVHATYTDKNIVGEGVKTFNLSPEQYPYMDIEIGCDYTVYFNERGYIASFEIA